MAATSEPVEWSEGDEAELAALLEDEQNGEGLDAYIRRVSPAHTPPRHIAPIVKLWDRTRTERVLACVELPPRHAKTTTGLHGLGMRLTRDPTLTNAFATYSDEYASSRSRIARTITRAGGVPLSKEMANLHEWRTTYGGGCIFRGYQGSWTGQGIDGVALIDDPYKDRAAAESKKIRENIKEWFADVLWTRLQPPPTGGHFGSCIVQHTRWHDDDLIGWLLSGNFGGYKFERIRLPAICEDEDDILGRQIGEALWPERFPVEELRKIETSIGPYSWASLFQQRPRPKGADVFLEPARYKLSEMSWKGKRILLCCDPAATDDNKADFSAAFVLAAEGYGADMQVWVVYGWRDRVTVPAVARKLYELSQRFWRAPIAVEAVGAFKAVPQILKEIEPRLRILPIKPQGDKFLRAQGVAAAWNAARVHVPLDAELVKRRGLAPISWAEELIIEATAFTGVGDLEDDQVDALAHGWNTLASGRTPRREPQKNFSPFG
jgi:hypothetical protein